MKKSYLAILAALASVGMVFSCNPDDPNKPDDPNNNTPEEPTEIITIDGDFSDWNSAANVVSTQVPDDLETYCNMLVMKAVADEDNVYLYFEYELAEDQQDAPFDIFFDADGDPTTGFISWIWSKDGCGWEYLLETEGGILKDGVVTNLSDMNIYKAVTTVNAATGEQLDGWDDDNGALFEGQDVTSFAEASGSVKNGVATFEVAILRSVINATKKGNVGVGITISDALWNTTGVLPIDESGVGTAEFLQVSLP